MMTHGQCRLRNIRIVADHAEDDLQFIEVRDDGLI